MHMDVAAIQLKVKNDARQFVLDCLNRNPVIVLGSGASVPHGLPSMNVLAEAIQTHVEGINAASSLARACYSLKTVPIYL
jgi:hypothetical protein